MKFNSLMKKIALLNVVGFLFYSCSSNEDSNSFNPPSFPKEVSVRPKLINVTKIFKNTSDINIVDSCLFIVASDNKYSVQVVDKRNGTFIKGIAPVGNGPGEFPTSKVHLHIDNDTISIYNTMLKSLYKYNFSTILKNSTPDKISKISGFGGIYDVYPLNKGFLSRPTLHYRFSIHDNEGIPIFKSKILPTIPNVDDSLIIKTILFNRQNFDIRPDKTKFVACSSLGAFMEIFSLNGDTISCHILKGYYLPKFIIKDSKFYRDPDGIVGFGEVKATDKFIYAMFYGIKQKSLIDLRADYIYVFDWDGEPVISYKIEGGVLNLAVDEKENRIYILTSSIDGSEAFGYFEMSR